MAGYWPSSLPPFCGPRESLGQHTGIWIEYACAIKDQIIWPKLKKKTFKTFLAETTREILSGQDRPFLPARVANQNTGFASSLSARGFSHAKVKLGLRFLGFEKHGAAIWIVVPFKATDLYQCGGGSSVKLLKEVENKQHVRFL